MCFHDGASLLLANDSHLDSLYVSTYQLLDENDSHLHLMLVSARFARLAKQVLTCLVSWHSLTMGGRGWVSRENIDVASLPLEKLNQTA